MSIPDKYDEQAEALLPCNKLLACDESGHDSWCFASLRPAIASALRAQVAEHCKDCCCARSWKALGISEYTGQGIPEHIAQLRQRIEQLEAALTLIASYQGKTLLGDGRYDEGANAAFEELAVIACAALEAK